ncbi:hypothetical protein BgiMline_008802 [Biomphalaria glabrata]|uniref:Uncharacterized protein LOC106056882 n=1 Tax=Biomphalaria glabrata TaxID=6526 RepID=A0A2C9KYN4_BIOGL|nr:uncharacterized protein LOC106056882 [Biomphalaria glabrata]KAI8735109.1 hypothetical protein BgiMline_027379 [Biomphalaria glabrata]KAI8784371.1 hypothetical protein BgiBS90_013898 [Biomphalaria glabrata]
MYMITGEMLPLFMAMVVVVPLTYQAIHGILERQFQFHTVLSIYLLRPMEIMLSIMMFPTAISYVFVMAIYMAMKETVSLTSNVVDVIVSSKYLYRALYVFLFLNIYLLTIAIAICIIKFVLNVIIEY